MGNARANKQLFIVRVWREPGTEGNPGHWRGSVEHAPGGERRYFDSLFVLVDIIGQSLPQDTDPEDPNASN